MHFLLKKGFSFPLGYISTKIAFYIKPESLKKMKKKICLAKKKNQKKIDVNKNEFECLH